jgi:glycosyltransferase involved in cell wall biosynthesis
MTNFQKDDGLSYDIDAEEVAISMADNSHSHAAPESAVIDVLMSPPPEKLTDNPFLALLFAKAADHGMRISAFSRKSLLVGRCNVIHIHWPEWHVRWKQVPGSLFDIVTFLSLLWLARRRGAAVVWTGHDLEPHELSRVRLWRFFHRLFLSQIDLLISFGKGATALLIDRYPQLAQVPVSIIPHGHYRDHYTAPADVTTFRDKLGLDQRPVFLYFGLIRPYKNIPSLIRAWKQLPTPRPQLVVAGRPLTPDLEAAIKHEAASADGVHLLLRFIHDAEVPTLFAAADAVVMPYAARSALNSGVAHLALSLGKPAVVNDTATNRDLQESFGPDWVWLCDGTPEDTLRVAGDAAASSRPEAPDLSVLDAARLGAETRQAYSDAIASRRAGRRRSGSAANGTPAIWRRQMGD